MSIQVKFVIPLVNVESKQLNEVVDGGKGGRWVCQDGREYEWQNG